VKLMIVPYINRPPMMDIAMAGTAIKPLWASNAGRAGKVIEVST